MMTRGEKILSSTTAMLMGLCAYVQFVSGNAADKNWLLLVAREWMGGRKLYADIFEPNPPLILWLYAIPVWISEHVSWLEDYNALALLGVAAVALTIHLCTGLIALHPAFAGEKRKQAAFALLLAAVLVFFTAPMFFFDREHILLVLTFPYILRFMPSLARQAIARRTRLLIGLLAGVGFCIKPHAAIVFCALQLLYIARERKAAILLSLENLLIYGVGGLYIAAVIRLTPEYISVVLPMAAATYSAYGQRANGIYSLVVFIVTIGISFADFRPRHASPFRRDIYYFLGVCAAYLVYALANNGWGYTYNPLISFARFLAGWVLMEFLWLKADAQARGLPLKPFIFGIRAGIFILGATAAFYTLCFAALFLPGNCDEDAACAKGRLLLEGARQFHVRSFGSISPSYIWDKLTRQTGARRDVRFFCLWMLPKFISSDAAFAREHHWIIDYVGKGYAEDLNRRMPELMFVDTSPEIMRNHPGVDLLGYLNEVPDFREAWKHYRRVGVIDACHVLLPGEPAPRELKSYCRMDVYRREPLP